MRKELFYLSILSGVAFSPLYANPEAGKKAFITCSACHKADGSGLDVGDKKMAPSLQGSAIVNGDPSILALTILKGIKKEGTEYIGMMTPLELAYKDDKVFADLLTYVRSSFGNSASAVTEEQAAEYREKWVDQKTPVTRAQLKELVQ